MWAGGVVMLLVALVSARELGRRAFVGFARLAPVLIALLVVAGVYLSFLRLPELADLWTTSYGQILMVKLGLVGLALTWGAAHHFVVEPRLDRPGIVSRLPRSIAGEAAVGMAVLLFAAILVNTAPPQSPDDAISLNEVPVGSAASARRPHGVSLAGVTTLPPSSRPARERRPCPRRRSRSSRTRALPRA